MSLYSQFGLEDMEALLWGPSSPMADPMGSIFVHLDKEQRGENSFEGSASPASPLNSSLSSSSSPPPFYSPPHSSPANLLGDKPRSDLLSIPWLDHPDLISLYVFAENAFEDLDWMAERVDLSEFDLDSLIGSCSPSEDSPSSPEDLLASLDCSMEFDPYPVTTFSSPLHTSFVPSTPPCVPEPQEELEIKSEPASPEPSSPAYTLELGSEVDVSESEVEVTEVKPVVAAVIPQIPRFVVSLSPTRIVLVLAPKEELGIDTTIATTEVSEPAPPTRSPRSRPYPEPKYKAGQSSPREGPTKGTERQKAQKMEQNKTAATRYRQKKRAEQDLLLDEYAVLERKNVELTEKAESMAREIKYLKELMEEVRLARIKKGLSS
uniref:Cyclic AMP-dependent transcription factor ATF-4 n=1 Tax=Neogobius melanostomus TaxID=47308 RepID=A0A8C6SB77_9GOBI